MPTEPAKSARPARQWILLWPLAALGLLLLFNFFFTPGFFHFEFEEGGYVSGSLVDVLKNGSIVMLLSLGMTLVIATGGVDLSVGAVMAIAGAVAATIINQPANNFALAVWRCGRCLAFSRRMEWTAGRRIWHSADRGHADSDGRRPRRGATHHRWPDHHLSRRTAHLPVQWPFPRRAVSCLDRGSHAAADGAVDPQNRLGAVHRVCRR